jgi:hypothetical protein
MYIPDFHGGNGHALCGDCIDLFVDGKSPPWKPHAIDRAAAMTKLALKRAFVSRPGPDEVFKLMAEFLKSWDQP